MPTPTTVSTIPRGKRDDRVQLRRSNNIGITQNSAGVADQAEPGDQFGRAVGNALRTS